MTDRVSPLPRIGFAVLVMLVIALGLWLGRSRPGVRVVPASSAPMEPTVAANFSAGSGPAPAAPGAAAAPHEKIPVPPCWEGLLALDQTATLDDLRAALAAAAAGEDPLLIEYLQSRLAELIGDNTSSALTLIGWAAQAQPPLIGHLLDALKRAPAAQQKKVGEQLLALGADAHASHDVRRAALDALDSQRSLSPAAIERIKSVALDDQADEVGWVATRTLGRVMVEDYKRTGHFEGYWRELLDVGQRSGDAAVRSLALEMPSYGDIPVDGASIAKLTQILKQDPDRQVREMAAFRLGLSRQPDRALQAFGEAFGSESNLCVRWAIFRFAVRAAGAKALPLLQKLAAVEPRLRPDYEDFRALYASGTVDFVRVWLGKPERQQCLDDGE